MSCGPARAAPFPRQPAGKMSAGDRRCGQAFAFRALPQKTFSFLEDREIGDRLLKWWEGEPEGWREGEAGGAGAGPSPPSGLRSGRPRARVSLPSPPAPLAGSLLSISEARNRLFWGARRLSLSSRISLDPFQIRSVVLMLLEQRSCRPQPSLEAAEDKKNKPPPTKT